MKKRLPRSFYRDQDVVAAAQALLGKVVCTKIDGVFSSAMIVEAEAYRGPEDRGSHAYRMRRTPRTEPMFWQGGTAYIYICYGIHHLFNVVTGDPEIPHAVLVRGVEPLEGLDVMLKRRSMERPERKLTAGPGILTIALGLHSAMTGQDMVQRNSPVWIEDRGIEIPMTEIVSGPRVGMNFPGKWATIPWRFSVKGNAWVSPAK